MKNNEGASILLISYYNAPDVKAPSERISMQ